MSKSQSFEGRGPVGAAGMDIPQGCYFLHYKRYPTDPFIRLRRTLEAGWVWRIPYLRRLLAERLQHFYNDDTKEEESVRQLIDSLVVK